MKQRFITGLLLVIFLAVNLWLPNWCMALATLICVCFAVWEEYHALVTAGHRVVTWPTWISLVTSIPLTIFFNMQPPSCQISVIFSSCLRISPIT